jgi:hypothetical protein
MALIAKKLIPALAQKLEASANFLAVLSITLIVASIIGQSRENILKGGWLIVAAVFTLHAGGFVFGYAFARTLRIATRTGPDDFDRGRYAEFRTRRCARVETFRGACSGAMRDLIAHAQHYRQHFGGIF